MIVPPIVGNVDLSPFMGGMGPKDDNVDDDSQNKRGALTLEHLLEHPFLQAPLEGIVLFPAVVHPPAAALAHEQQQYMRQM